MRSLSVPLYQGGRYQTVLGALDGHGPASLPVPNPTPGFWTDSSPDANPFAKEGSEGPLTEDADVCIIGSGITGISAAYHLSKAAQVNDKLGPLKVVILEARDFCSGATGRNGGHFVPYNFLRFRSNTKEFGIYDAMKAFQIEEHVFREVRKIVDTHKLEKKTDFVNGGRTVLFFTPEEEEDTRRDYEAAKAAGIDVSEVVWLDKETVEKTYGTSYPAVRIPGSNLWPLKLVSEFYKVAQNSTDTFSLGLHTHTPVTSVTPGNSSARRWSVNTPRGSIQCSYVVHATNGYASHLLPQLTGPAGIVPTRSQVVAVRADAPASEFTDSGFTANEKFEYWFPRPAAEGEKPLVILGGGRELSPTFELYETDDSTLNEEVSTALREFLPALFPGKFGEGKEPEMEWTGIWGATSLGDPFVGPVLDKFDEVATSSYSGQFIAAGYSGHGMTRAYACADVVARMITAQISGTEWEVPDWLPVHYLTTRRPELTTRAEWTRARAAAG